MDQSGVDWISVGDHFYPPPPLVDTRPYFEAISLLSAMAVETKHARLGSLVFGVPFRNPAALAKAFTTIDHLSHGRLEIGLGAGWHEAEFAAFGYDYPPIGQRLDMLEEAIQIIRSMLTQERTTFQGRYFRAQDVTCQPPPLQEHIPIWIGGRGERRTLRIAARHADGWNANSVSPTEFARLSAILDRWCERENRDPATIRRSVNLSFNCFTDPTQAEEVARSIGNPDGWLLGTPDTAAEQVAAYLRAGANGVNVLVRNPWDPEALRIYLEETLPALRTQFA
jgi:alkanesulfonate monooxygenase SsuD/methylene tetrahydromethanopterin reductase-like flavin-dependent oxidoreductase (luciferase family)